MARRALPVVGILLIVAGTAMAAGITADDGRPEAPLVAAEVPVTAMDQGRGAANNSPMVVADPADRRVVVVANRLDAPTFSCALQVSTDEGRSWLTAQPVPELPPGAERCYAPEVVFGVGGALHYLFVGLAGNGNLPMGAFLTTSSDRGRTFSAPRRVLGPLNFAVRLAVDPTLGPKGRIHLVWLHATSDPPLGGFGPPPNPILAAQSDDGGLTFSEPVQVSDTARERVVAPAVMLGVDHALHVAYYDLGADARDYQGLDGPTWEGTWSVVLSTSTDGGRTFAPAEVVDDEVAPPERVMLIFTMAPPSLVLDGDGRLCAAWTDARHGDPDVLARCSRGQPRRWGGPVRMNDDPVSNGRSQYLPRLSVAPGGRVDAVFYDRRNDQENVLNDVFFTFSDDGGNSFARNRRVTRDPSSSLIGQRYLNVSAAGQVEFGSRLALLSRREGALAVWTDTRNSRPNTGQDLFAAAIVFPTSSDAGAPLWGAALAVTGAVFVALSFLLRRRGVAGPNGVATPVAGAAAETP